MGDNKQNDEKEERKLTYKRQSVLAPYCGVCEQFLWGNNSLAHPYMCGCGTWRDIIGRDYHATGFFRIEPYNNSKLVEEIFNE